MRMRNLRKDRKTRERFSETSLTPGDLIYPIFIKEGINQKEPIKGLPGQFRHSLKDVSRIIRRCEESGVMGVLLFGVPKKKDRVGSEAWNGNGIVQRAIKIIKKTSTLLVFADVCLCQYSSHGHCGFLRNNKVDNDKTLELLCKIAVSYAQSGADFVCPSAMMDFQVSHIRKALDKNGFKSVKIMAYSAKFASNFYGPFREAVHSAPKYGPKDRRTYQMDFRNGKQALKEIALDIKEGADIVMVKPALGYLDIISKSKERFNVPIAAYNVSGEYAMLRNSGINALYEALICIKRAGADIIISYGALEILGWLNDNRD